MNVGEICNRHTSILGRDDSIYLAATLMRDHHVDYVVVVESEEGNNIPIGALSNRDIVVKMIAEKLELDRFTVGDVMNSQLLLANEQDDVMTTLKRMRLNGVRCLPIVNENRALVGTLSIDNILDTLSELLNDIGHIIKQQQLLQHEHLFQQH
jgi:CBS domain-containing protein